MTKQTRLAVTHSAAGALVKVLTNLGYPCALYGEIASYGYGLSRVPKKVEALVFTLVPEEPSIEDLKMMIVQSPIGFSYFYLTSVNGKPSVLNYLDHTIEGQKKKTCTVELTYLPEAPLNLIREVNSLPLVPLQYLLLCNLEQWDTKKTAGLKQQKKLICNINSLLALSKPMIPDDTPLCSSLHESSKTRVIDYCIYFPEKADAWRRLGFDVSASVDIQSRRSAALSPHLTWVKGPAFQAQPTPDQLFIESPSRIQMVYLAALKTVSLLGRLGYSSALFGSLACFLYGHTRSPNDVDLLVLPFPGNPITIEELKCSIVSSDPAHFFLIPGRDPRANYQVLYFRLTDIPSGHTPLTSCKVDVVFPGTLHLPRIPLTLIEWDDGLPAVPYSLLLLQKLQGWDDHRRSGDDLKRLKQRTDADDLRGLLKLSALVVLRFSRPWTDRRLFSPQFEVLSRMRVRDFCAEFPECMEEWKRFGFET